MNLAETRARFRAREKAQKVERPAMDYCAYGHKKLACSDCGTCGTPGELKTKDPVEWKLQCDIYTKWAVAGFPGESEM